MANAYDPTVVEASWGDWWEASGYYSCDAEAAAKAKYEDKFVMVIPPPNVTGSLHIGHALTVAIEDTIVRYHRMCGKMVMWVPGTDHAGIATQAVVEKKLKKERGLTRKDLGREKFVEEVWKWKEEYGTRITHQIRRLGSSVDWSREAFTMDDQLSAGVKEAFVRMFDDGLIQRQDRLVNWSCALRTCISDIEVDTLELTGRTLKSVVGHDPAKKYEFGMITSFAYKVDGLDEELVVATTRLETMLGDTAVAVHPEDARYTHLHGKFLVHPFNGRKIPIVTDPVLVDMTFGTGAVKITPAHDPNDFECGERHGLPKINVLDDFGQINAEGGAAFEGMMRFDARVAIEEALTELGLFRGKADNVMNIPICSRSGDVIEPRIKKQWFCKCAGMAKAATDAVRNGDLEILPKTHEATWFRWLDNSRDWCISRQLWWGHRIPAYKVTVDDASAHADGKTDAWVVGRTEEEAMANAVEKFGVDAAKAKLTQDEDVLDTWFSSGLFPFSVFGWPNESKDNDDLNAFYPGHLLETGHDILFFWVARMVMMGLQLTGKLPFKQVYLHAMVRDKHGRKMSKSRGNVIDPLDVIEGKSLAGLQERLAGGNLDDKEVKIASATMSEDFPTGIDQCGTDALRFGLLAYTIQGRDINLDIQRVIGWRQFCNKLWNATKFCISMLGDYTPETDAVQLLCDNFGALPARNQWILAQLNACVAECHAQMAAYGFAHVATALYDFWLKRLCDVFVELSKPVLYGEDPTDKLTTQRCLFVCVEWGLRLLHPMMPFVTEELWQRLLTLTKARAVAGADAVYPATIMLAAYPRPQDAWDNEAGRASEAGMDMALKVVAAARSLKTAYNVPNGKDAPRPEVFAVVGGETKEAELAGYAAFTADIVTLAKIGEVHFVGGQGAVSNPNECVLHNGDGVDVFLRLKGNVDAAGEIKKLEKSKGLKAKSLASLTKKMGSAHYAGKVPEDVQKKDVEKCETLTREIEQIQAQIARMELMA